ELLDLWKKVAEFEYGKMTSLLQLAPKHLHNFPFNTNCYFCRNEFNERGKPLWIWAVGCKCQNKFACEIHWEENFDCCDNQKILYWNSKPEINNLFDAL